MRWGIPVLAGVVFLAMGVVWASQGAGIVGGSSFMDNNPTFINLGGFVAAFGVALVALGVFLKTRSKASAK